ncbi:hypothetical protein M2133_000452 [Parabacteroides sp. PF5-6]|nr:hypothetical protein [Parabacteroides sp. PF5-6]
MKRRGICREQVLSVISMPEEVIIDTDDPTVRIYQSVVEEQGKSFLLRVFVNICKQPQVIITLYRTTKISKYYEGKI